jgi:hypothetical protein
MTWRAPIAPAKPDLLLWLSVGSADDRQETERKEAGHAKKKGTCEGTRQEGATEGE